MKLFKVYSKQHLCCIAKCSLGKPYSEIKKITEILEKVNKNNILLKVGYIMKNDCIGTIKLIFSNGEIIKIE